MKIAENIENNEKDKNYIKTGRNKNEYERL